MDLDLRVAVGKYLRTTGDYVSNRVGAVVGVAFDIFSDHDRGTGDCLSTPRIAIEFDYWDSSYSHSLRVLHDIEGDEELVKFLAVIARRK